MTQSRVTIIMGLYNCQETLAEAVASLHEQTFTDWHLIMCEDGSTDQTLQIARELQQIAPHKMTLLRNKENQGLNYTLNRCLQAAKSEYIARQDADDCSKPDRLLQEVTFLEQHPEFGFVSCAKAHFDEQGIWGICNYLPSPTAIDLVKEPEFCHPASLFRRTALEAVAGYSEGERLLRVEDYHLWFKLLAAGIRGFNLSEVYYLYRDDRTSFQRRHFRYRLNECYVKHLIIQENNLSKVNYVQLLRPVIVGLLPQTVYDRLHKHRFQQEVSS